MASADNTGDNECGKCKNGLSLFPVYVGFTVVCSYMYEPFDSIILYVGQ